MRGRLSCRPLTLWGYPESLVCADDLREEALALAQSDLLPVSPLRGLLEVTRLVRTAGDVPELLWAIARVIAESLGYGTVAINLYRPEWDDFQTAAVHGGEEAKKTLVGHVRRIEEWEPLLAERFHRRGAYVVLAGQFDWATLSDDGVVYVCGDGRFMAPAVRETLIRIHMERRGTTLEKSSDWLEGMIEANRYNQDVFGFK